MAEYLDLEVHSVQIRHCGIKKIPKRSPSKMVVNVVDGQANTYSGELIYDEPPIIVRFKTELTKEEIAILDRLARRVTGRMHRNLRAQEGYTEAEWNARHEAFADMFKSKPDRKS